MEAGAALAATVEVVVAVEQVDLELESPRCEGDVDVAVAARGEAVLPRGHVVGAFRPVDHDPVSRVAERRRDLDLRDIRLGRRPGTEEAFALVERQPLVRPHPADDRDGVCVRRRRASARRRHGAEADLAPCDVEDGRPARGNGRAHRSGHRVECARLRAREPRQRECQDRDHPGRQEPSRSPRGSPPGEGERNCRHATPEGGSRLRPASGRGRRRSAPCPCQGRR
jgi:hypothetical protein